MRIPRRKKWRMALIKLRTAKRLVKLHERIEHIKTDSQGIA